MVWILLIIVSLWLVIKDGIRRDRERRKYIPDTKEWVHETTKPGAGIFMD